jgi:RNA polymerase sigma-70 factor (ECF subfamily)
LNTEIQYSEAELVTALKLKDSAAFRHLYMYYKGSLFTIISQVVPETETANDVLQETFITIWKNIDKYDPGKGRLFTWLLNVARNMAINKIRSKNYKNALKNEDIGNFVNSIEQTGTNQPNINRIGLQKEVSRLRDDLKNVLALSYYHGYTQEEISKALNIPLGTVKTRLRTAILELRKQFQEK